MGLLRTIFPFFFFVEYTWILSWEHTFPVMVSGHKNPIEESIKILIMSKVISILIRETYCVYPGDDLTSISKVLITEYSSYFVWT